MTIDKPRCEICKYHDLTPAGNRGRCRRFPPSQLGGSINTGPGDWCGEYLQDDDKLKALQLKQKIQEKK